MSKRYRPWKIDEPMLLPATVQEFVDKDHLARFVLSLVVEGIDLEEIEPGYRVEAGRLARAPGLVPPGHVALDGTKITANASKHKGMSYERNVNRAEELKAEVAGLM